VCWDATAEGFDEEFRKLSYYYDDDDVCFVFKLMIRWLCCFRETNTFQYRCSFICVLPPTNFFYVFFKFTTSYYSRFFCVLSISANFNINSKLNSSLGMYVLIWFFLYVSRCSFVCLLLRMCYYLNSIDIPCLFIAPEVFLPFAFPHPSLSLYLNAVNCKGWTEFWIKNSVHPLQFTAFK